MARDVDIGKVLFDGLTSFKQESVAATDVNGTTWKDLLDKSLGGASPLSKETRICGFKATVGGTWAGSAKIRVVDGAGNKIFPFEDEWIEGTHFTTATRKTFDIPVAVPVEKGYKFQFRSSNAGDGAGETLALNNLDVIEIG